MKKLLHHFIVLIFLIGLIALSIVIVYFVSAYQTEVYLHGVNQRVDEDVTYTNGKWNTNRYNADPDLPETFPLYVFSLDGYVVDRWKPIHGFLDTSDTARLLRYTSPTSVTTDTNDNWRIVSKPIKDRGENAGLITIAKHQPSGETIEETDRQLLSALSDLESKISFRNNQLVTQSIDPRDIPFDISFQIIDKYNHIVLNNNNTNSINRIPNYIDSSYIGNLMNGPRVRQIQDTQTRRTYLLVTTPLKTKKGDVVGVVVAGREISSLFSAMKTIILIEGLFGLVAVIIFTLGYDSLLSIQRKRLLGQSVKPQEVHNISFDKKTGDIDIDGEKVAIPFATIQFYFCGALFSQPRKRWKVEELLKKFGEQDVTNWRRIYDAMAIINRKTSSLLGDRLIVNKDKTYSINPLFSDKVLKL